MPAKDIYHDAVKNALVKDGWIVIDDPFQLKFGLRELFVDLGVKKLLSAKKKEKQILVEIKSFNNPSPVADLEQALGQYILYSNILEEQKSSLTLYMAIRYDTYCQIFSEPLGLLVTRKNNVSLLIFDPKKEEILEWKPQNN